MEQYLLFGTEDAYQKVKSILQERYGNCNVVSTTFISKLEKWLKIGPQDAVASRKFSGFLDRNLAPKETIPGLSVLRYAKENAKLLAKLPYCIEIKWRDTINQWLHTHSEAGYPTFSKFASFVKEAADKANIPELERLSNSSRPNFKSRQKPDRNKGSSLVTSAVGRSNREEDSSSASKQSRSGPAKLNNCLFCGAVHELEDCSDFR